MGFVSVLEYAKKLVRDAVQPGDVCIDATVGGGVDTLFLAECVGAGGQVHGFDIQAEALERAGHRLALSSIGWEFARANAGAGPTMSMDALVQGSGDWAVETANTLELGSSNRTAESADALKPISTEREMGKIGALEWAKGDQDTGGADLRGSATGEKNGVSPWPTRVWLHRASHDRMESLVPIGAKGRVAAAMFNLGYLPGSDHAIVTRPNTTVRALGQALELLRPGGVLSIVVYTGHPGGLEEEAAVREWMGDRSSSEADILEYRFHRRDRAAPYLLAIMKRSS